MRPQLQEARSGGRVRHHRRVPMTQASFIQHLLEAVPKARATVDEHLEENDELLLHLLMAALLRPLPVRLA